MLKRSGLLYVLFGLFAQVAVVDGQAPCLSGKEGNIWYFGDSVGLNFNTLPPTVLSDSRMATYEASTIVSDSAGNLLFYSNGELAWDRNHDLMAGLLPFNINRLLGSNSETQILSLEHPGQEGRFYIFYMETVDNVNNNPALDTNRIFFFAVMDINAYGGLGDVVSKNNPLFAKSTEKVAATRHCNGEDWWIVTQSSGSNQFWVWLLTQNGLSLNPQIYSIGKGCSPIGGTKAGVLKFSPNGSLLLELTPAQIAFGGATYDAHAEIYKFNNSTGEITESVRLLDSVRSVYGAEFSPDSRKLYFNAWTPLDSLYQYDLCVYDSAAIVQSKVNLGKAAGNTGQFLLGPDGKMYISRAFRNYLSIIHNPNEKGAACNYEPDAILLPRESGYGFPTFPANYYAPGKPYINTDRPCETLCQDSVVRYHVTGSCEAGAQYAWSVSGGEVVSAVRDTAWVRWTTPGAGYVAVEKTWFCGVRSDTLRVAVESCAPCAPVYHFENASTCDVALAGTDTLFLQTAFGCDSLVITQTVLQPIYTVNQAASTCDPALAGTDTLFLQTAFGCDSLIITQTALQPAYTAIQTATTCDPALAGTDTLFLQTAFGCDSLIVTETVLQPAYTVIQTASTCDAALAGTDTLFFQTAFGCDSLIVTETVLQPAYTVNQTVSTCDPALAGTDTLFLQTAFGCDSLIITQTALQPAYTAIQTATTCDPALAGTDTLFLQTAFGCDSLIVTETVLLPAYTVNQTASTCDAALAGTDTLFLQTAFGCDSLVVTETLWQALSVDAGMDQSVTWGDSIRLSVSTNAVNGSIVWQPAGILGCPNCLETWAFPKENTLMRVQVTDANGCAGEDELWIEVLKQTGVYAPNIFRPGSTDANSYFFVFAPQARIQWLQVYSRWGELMYQGQPQQPEQGWDGRFRGREVDNGVYVWMCTLEYPDGHTEHLNGAVTVVR